MASAVSAESRAVAIHAGVFIVLGVTQIVAKALIMLYATPYKDTPRLKSIRLTSPAPRRPPERASRPGRLVVRELLEQLRDNAWRHGIDDGAAYRPLVRPAGREHPVTCGHRVVSR